MNWSSYLQIQGLSSWVLTNLLYQWSNLIISLNMTPKLISTIDWEYTLCPQFLGWAATKMVSWAYLQLSGGGWKNQWGVNKKHQWSWDFSKACILQEQEGFLEVAGLEPCSKRWGAPRRGTRLEKQGVQRWKMRGKGCPWGRELNRGRRRNKQGEWGDYRGF